MVTVALKDKEQRVVRSFMVEPQATYEVVRIIETGRMEMVLDLSELDRDAVEYTKLDRVPMSRVNGSGYRLTPYLSLVSVGSNDSATWLPELDKEDDDKAIADALRWSAVVHLSAVALIFLFGWLLHGYFQPKPTEKQVTVISPQVTDEILKKTMVPVKNPPRVKMAENAAQIQPRANTIRSRFDGHLKKVKSNSAAVPTGFKKGKIAEIGTLDTLDKIGGIGNSTQGKNKGTGFGKINRGFFGSGTGMGGGLGAGTTGGIKNALGGRGLVAGLSGEGSQSFGAHGYGNDKEGGGRAGYGGASVGDKITKGLNHMMVPGFDDSEVVGGLTRQQVEAVVAKNQGQLLYCYEKALQSKPQLHGRMNTKWVVGSSGDVRTVQLGGSSLNSTDVEKCVINAIRAWKFPRPVGGVTVDVQYPFDFGRTSLVKREG